ncbi:ADP-ribosylation/crystallin J1 [Nocardia stercoris]|uniref:ADP-ribosylation/crystallin J1 n=1 Tax=Nocardia stercoris TaxID=2483361 RepID=A0A3M2L146_9NOCA|nr:ADP-ribosylation/crystallin J1 [Nocardia stercoris]RMI28268.1 ADP-ribosylation/crystallin J1 [Nocardia stercoris]
MTSRQTTILWRPTGPQELALVAASGWREWPARLPDQPIFYPVLTEEYAIMIARDWNVPASGCGFVTRFAVDTDYLAGYDVQQVGGREILEYWIPAEELPNFNAHIVGRIEVVHRFPAEADYLRADRHR